MGRYYFHVRTRTDVEIDDVGLELDDLGAAHREAVLGARDLVAEHASLGLDATEWEIEIADGSGTVRDRVAVRDALARE